MKKVIVKQHPDELFCEGEDVILKQSPFSMFSHLADKGDVITIEEIIDKDKFYFKLPNKPIKFVCYFDWVEKINAQELRYKVGDKLTLKESPFAFNKILVPGDTVEIYEIIDDETFNFKIGDSTVTYTCYFSWCELPEQA